MIKTVTEFFEKGGEACKCGMNHDGDCDTRAMTEGETEIANLLDEAFEDDEVCEICGGVNGEHEDISTMESVYPNEPHMADIGSRPCPNSISERDEYDDQE